jgi:23S rRNA pseudouridine2605 synthase
MEKQRIQKILANAGVDSRRNVEQMILDGRIAVNGRIAHKLPVLIDPEHDKIEVDGETIKLRRQSRDQRIYLLLNKPKNVITTNVAQGEQVRAIDLLPPNLPSRIYPVGRLDAQTKGLLLMTNDGDLTHRLTHPKFGVIKTYRAVMDGYVADQMLSKLEKGIWLPARDGGKGFRSAPGKVKIFKRTDELTIVDIMLREGANSQLRRIFAAAGHKVRDLTRIRFGPLSLEGLLVGHVRKLTTREVKDLQKCARAERPESKTKNPHEDEPDSEFE